MKRILLFLFFIQITVAHAQQSVARKWNEVQLEAIRRDFTRPPQQARNLFYVSAAMYDAWAAYQVPSNLFMLGKTVNGFTMPYSTINANLSNIDSLRNIAISYAAYRSLRMHYQNSAQAANNFARFDSLMNALGLNTNYTSTNYSSGNPADLGNYIASQYNAYSLTDSSNEINSFTNQFYSPINSGTIPAFPGVSNYNNLNRWQPLFIANAVDQNGNPVYSGQSFLGAEWGRVKPFALPANQAVYYTRNGQHYPVYLNPPAPPLWSATANDSAS
jgi:hypothetical protein